MWPLNFLVVLRVSTNEIKTHISALNSVSRWHAHISWNRLTSTVNELNPPQFSDKASCSVMVVLEAHTKIKAPSLMSHTQHWISMFAKCMHFWCNALFLTHASSCMPAWSGHSPRTSEVVYGTYTCEATSQLLPCNPPSRVKPAFSLLILLLYIVTWPTEAALGLDS